MRWRTLQSYTHPRTQPINQPAHFHGIHKTVTSGYLEPKERHQLFDAVKNSVQYSRISTIMCSVNWVDAGYLQAVWLWYRFVFFVRHIETDNEDFKHPLLARFSTGCKIHRLATGFMLHRYQNVNHNCYFRFASYFLGAFTVRELR